MARSSRNCTTGVPVARACSFLCTPARCRRAHQPPLQLRRRGLPGAKAIPGRIELFNEQTNVSTAVLPPLRPLPQLRGAPAHDGAQVDCKLGIGAPVVHAFAFLSAPGPAIRFCRRRQSADAAASAARLRPPGDSGIEPPITPALLCSPIGQLGRAVWAFGCQLKNELWCRVPRCGK
jgi:hypothetical protein